MAAPSPVASQGSPPHPRAPPYALDAGLCPNKESGCAAREPQGAARTLAGTRLPGRSWRWGGGGGVGMARGFSANRRAPLRPPDVARRKMLQPWTAPRSASQVQGAAAESGSAAGTAAVGQGGVARRERGPRRAPSSTSASLTGWHVRECFRSHLIGWVCRPGQGMHSARFGVRGYC